jgi:hypothetical protein
MFARTPLVGTKREAQETEYLVTSSGVHVLVRTLVEILGASIVLAGANVGGLAPRSLVSQWPENEAHHCGVVRVFVGEP